MHKPLLNKAISLHQKGEHECALNLCQELVVTYPRVADVHHLQGILYLEINQPENAAACISQALKINSNNVFYLNNLGIAQLNNGWLQDAVSSFKKALSLNPAFAQANFNLGNAYYELRQYKLAVGSYNCAIDLDAAQFAFHLNLANAYRELEEFSSALHAYDIALSLNLVDASIWLNKGLCLQLMQEPMQAIDCFLQVVKLDPDHWDAYWTLGRLNMNLGHWRQAVDYLTLAASGRSSSAELWNDLGIALNRSAIPSQALIAFQMALSLNSKFEQAHNNLGAVLHSLQRYAGALDHFEKALKIEPTYKAANLNKAFTLLLNGYLADGLQNFEYRNWQGDLQPKWIPKNKPAWTGQQAIQGQKLLVYAEQGFGDTIQFSRYLSLLSKLGPQIFFAVQKCLLPLFASHECIVKLVDLDDVVTDFDFHVSLMSLPHIFGSVIDTIPEESFNFRVVDESVLFKWKNFLGSKSSPRVGLVWSGSSTHTNDANRSLPLKKLLSYLPQGMDYIALQKEVRDSDIADLLASPIRSFKFDIHDFQDTAAICQQLDLVIAVDTSVAHLSASLNCPTWIMLPLVPDWRWFLDREDSPWYSSVRLFRQERAGDWDQVLQSVKISLHQEFN